MSLALPPTNNEKFLIEILSNFSKEHSGICFNIYELLSEQVAEYVHDGLAEIGFIRAPLSEMQMFHFYPVKEETLKVIMKKEHPLARWKKLACSSWIDVRLPFPEVGLIQYRGS